MHADFDGDTYDSERDFARLDAQLDRVREVMSDGRWYTLAELSERAGGCLTSISARIRDLRKPKFGAHTVHSECVRQGLWRYRVVTARTHTEIPIKIAVEK